MFGHFRQLDIDAFLPMVLRPVTQLLLRTLVIGTGLLHQVNDAAGDKRFFRDQRVQQLHQPGESKSKRERDPVMGLWKSVPSAKIIDHLPDPGHFWSDNVESFVPYKTGSGCRKRGTLTDIATVDEGHSRSSSGNQGYQVSLQAWNQYRQQAECVA